MPKPDQSALQLSYRIHTLLHTMRAIARQEDALCTLMTAVESSGRVDQSLDEELRALLEAMPFHEYADDIDAIREALLLATPPVSRPKKTAASRRASAEARP